MGWLQAAKTTGLVIGGSVAGMWATLTILGNTVAPAADGPDTLLMYTVVYAVGGVVPPLVVIPVIIRKHRARSGPFGAEPGGALPVWVTVGVLAAWSASNVPQILSTAELHQIMLAGTGG